MPCAVLLFPIVYVVDDILAEIYGFRKARNVIYLAFIMNFIAVDFYNISIILPAPSYFVGAEAFELVLGNSLRILVASFLAFLFGSLLMLM